MGKPGEGCAKHGGDIRALAAAAGCEPGTLRDFSASINPLGPPSWLSEAISSHVGELSHYPDPGAQEVVEAVCCQLPARPSEVVVGNGSSEILSLLPRALSPRRVVVLAPAYGEYERAARLAGCQVEVVLLREDQGFAPDFAGLCSQLAASDLVMLGQPNNPTGALFDPEALRQLVLACPHTWFVVDESFFQFVDNCDSLTRERPANAIVVRSLTKFYAIPGLRLGFAVAEAQVAGPLRRLAVPWSVNTLAQVVGARALGDDAYAAATQAYVSAERAWLESQLRELPGLTVFPSSANFLLVRSNCPGCEARILAGRLLQQRIAIRVCDDFCGLDQRYFRVAVRTRPNNSLLVEALAAVLNEERNKLVERSGPAGEAGARLI